MEYKLGRAVKEWDTQVYGKYRWARKKKLLHITYLHYEQYIVI